jgi:hypothetical protein
MKQVFFAAFAAVSIGLQVSASQYDVAAYVWPAYQPEPRWAEMGIYADGKGEWQNVKEAVPKWKGHRQPVVPLWGYENEADPVVMEKKINAAVSYGVNVFIYDWYWYDKRPFLEDALNKGFLGAKNNDKMKFFIMWANHHFTRYCDNRSTDDSIVWRGWVNEVEFKKISKRWIEMYFSRPNYYRIGGKPVLMIYELKTFVEGLGGLKRAAAALNAFRDECVKAGLGGVHIMVSDFKLDAKQVRRLGVESATIYNFIHRSSTKGNPDYAQWAKRGANRFDKAKKATGVKMYFAHASIGWDNNARFPAGTVRPAAMNSTPEKFEKVLRRAKAWCDKNTAPGAPKLITINAWNEWAEGNHLEPDRRNGRKYLEATKRVLQKNK